MEEPWLLQLKSTERYIKIKEAYQLHRLERSPYWLPRSLTMFGAARGGCGPRSTFSSPGDKGPSGVDNGRSAYIRLR